MKKNSGQALIEFIIVLPVLALIIASMVDVFNILNKKYELENNLNTIITLYENNDIEAIDKLSFEKKLSVRYINSTNTTEIFVDKNIRITTPILKNILGNPYKITISRVIYDEEE